MITIKEMQLEDIPGIVESARAADIEEMLACSGCSVGEALSYGIRQSLRAWVIDSGGLPLAAVGDTLAGIGTGVPWMVTTNHLKTNPRGFLRASRAILLDMLQRHQQLTNYVDVRNADAIRWLEWLGFAMGEPIPYGVHRLPFRRFYLERRP